MPNIITKSSLNENRSSWETSRYDRRGRPRPLVKHVLANAIIAGDACRALRQVSIEMKAKIKARNASDKYRPAIIFKNKRIKAGIVASASTPSAALALAQNDASAATMA